MHLPKELVVGCWNLTLCGSSDVYAAYSAEPTSVTNLQLEFVNVDFYGTPQESVQCVFYFGDDKYKLRLLCKLKDLSLDQIYRAAKEDVNMRGIHLDAARQFEKLSREVLKSVMNDLHDKQ